MSFISLKFIFFFVIVILISFVLPQKIKHLWLLAASYYFYMSWNAEYALLILTSTVVTYVSGLILEKIKENSDSTKVALQKKICMAVSLFVNFGILGYFKYTQFFFNTIREFCMLFGYYVEEYRFDILLPVGISFYTFQALGYTIDVYRDEIPAEKNFFRYALFVSFFPQLVAGPIERSKELLNQINQKQELTFENFRNGFICMLWGYFLKIVIAERIAVFVDTVYGDYYTYGGVYIVVATMLFAVQIYCDFNGYTMIARGAAQIMGFRLMENFDAPYLSVSVADFWRRWHISLTSWFKDYFYIPLGGSRRGKIRKYLNKMIVFLASGLWHGANLTFVLWGGLNGLYQVIGEILQPIRQKIAQIAGISSGTITTKIVKGFLTFILVDFSWIFFRANSLREAFRIIEQMVMVKNPWVLFDESLYGCGLDHKNFGFMLFSIGILLATDICRRLRIDLYQVYARQDRWFRCLFISGFLIFLFVFGKYGPAYDNANFIYFQF